MIKLEIKSYVLENNIILIIKNIIQIRNYIYKNKE
jgi:hypothetical protein